jgi:hypothetical protein
MLKQKARVLSFFQACLLFTSKAGTHLSGAPYGVIRAKSLPTIKYVTSKS